MTYGRVIAVVSLPVNASEGMPLPMCIAVVRGSAVGKLRRGVLMTFIGGMEDAVTVADGLRDMREVPGLSRAVEAPDLLAMHLTCPLDPCMHV